MNCTINCIFAHHLTYANNTRHIYCGRGFGRAMTTDDSCRFYDELSPHLNKKELGIYFLGDGAKKRK